MATKRVPKYQRIVDWADVDKRGECTAYNALFAGALDAIAAMAEVKGDIFTKDLAEGYRSRLNASFQERLFCEQRGCFADARVDEALSPMTSEHANFAAINWGLCDQATARRIVQRIFDAQADCGATEAQPFFMVVVLNALAKLGRLDLALELIRGRWGKRMVERGATSTFEEWYQNGSWRHGQWLGFLRSHSHAWSACPAEFLPRALIGLEIVEPGCAKLRLDPHYLGFAYAVTYPIPQGVVRVQVTDGGVEVAVPEDVVILD